MTTFNESHYTDLTADQRNLIQEIASSLRTQPEHDITVGKSLFYWLGSEQNDQSGMHENVLLIRSECLTREVLVRLDYSKS